MWGLQPWRRGSFKFSTDPQMEAELTGVAGLYLNPPDNAVVVCVDKKPGPGRGPDPAHLANAARNMVEVFFSIITRHAIRRGTYRRAGH